MADAGRKISRFKRRISLAEFRQQRDLLGSVVLTRSFALRLVAISDDILVIDQPINTLTIRPLTRPIDRNGLHGCARIPQSASELGRASTSLIPLDTPAEQFYSLFGCD